MNKLYNPNRRNYAVLIPIVVILASAGALVAIPKFLEAERWEDAVTREKRIRIENMTKLEKDRLKRKFANYKALSDEDKKRYRNLHEVLEKDEKDGGNLKDVMKNYDHWLGNKITLHQLEELKSIDNSEEKMRLVADYLDEQEERNSKPGGRRRGFSLFLHTLVSISGEMKLTMEDVKEIAKYYESDLKLKIDMQKHSSYDQKYLVVLNEVLKKNLLQKKPRYIDDTSILDMMKKNHADPALVGRIRKSAEKSNGDYDVLGDIFWTVGAELRKRFVDEEKSFKRGLTESTKREVFSTSPREHRVQLQRVFYRKHAPEYWEFVRNYYGHRMRQKSNGKSKRNSRGKR